MGNHVVVQVRAQFLGTAGREMEPTTGEATHEGAMKNHLSTKITAKQHAGEFKGDFYADGDLLFLFFAPAVSKH